MKTDFILSSYLLQTTNTILSEENKKRRNKRKKGVRIVILLFLETGTRIPEKIHYYASSQHKFHLWRNINQFLKNELLLFMN